MCAAGIPARIARAASYPLLASMCSPSSWNTRSTEAFGQAFIAYRAVSPKAFGNASTSRPRASSDARSYTNTGVPNSRRTRRTSSSVKKVSFSIEFPCKWPVELHNKPNMPVRRAATRNPHKGGASGIPLDVP